MFYHSILLLKKGNCVESNTKFLMKTYKTGKYVHIKKICNNHNHLEMLAIDQRPPIFNIIKKKKKNYKFDDVVTFKKHISQNLSGLSSAILMDHVYSIQNLIPTSKSNG